MNTKDVKVARKTTFRVTHRGTPAEPWGIPGATGIVKSAKPGEGMIPAQAYVDWGEYETWERCSDLSLQPSTVKLKVRKDRKWHPREVSIKEWDGVRFVQSAMTETNSKSPPRE